MGHMACSVCCSMKERMDLILWRHAEAEELGEGNG